ncbi:MAG: hypothetical protein D3923_07515 [Candidatus Electrothrix sp. AR3]|nr:hypothetical protein [Candidatus Electrothrix sp. AR3]
MKDQHILKYNCPITDKIEKITIEHTIKSLHYHTLFPQIDDFSTKMTHCTSFNLCKKKCILELE